MKKKIILFLFILINSLFVCAQTEFHIVRNGWISTSNKGKTIIRTDELTIDKYNLSFSTQTIKDCFKENLFKKFGNSPIDTLNSTYQKEYIWTNIQKFDRKINSSITLKVVVSKYKHPLGNYDDFTFYILDENGKDLLIPKTKTQKRYSKIITKWVKECL